MLHTGPLNLGKTPQKNSFDGEEIKATVQQTSAVKVVKTRGWFLPLTTTCSVLVLVFGIFSGLFIA